MMRLGIGLAAVAAMLAHSVPAAAQDAEPIAKFEWFSYEGSDPTDAISEPGPGQYRNPVIQGFYPDPSVVRVEEDYYLVNSTFGYWPGLPVFHSRDLVNWTQIGNAIDRPDQLPLGRGEMTKGTFAPAIEYHDGKFYIVNTCFGCEWNFVITADDPAGPWSDPVWLPDLGGGIDPSLFFDESTGRAWIVNNDVPAGGETYPGHRAIFVQEFDTATLSTKGPRTMILNGGLRLADKPEYVEGPHIFRRGDWYYLTAAEGGTGLKHQQIVLRSKSVTGPYLAAPVNPVLTQNTLPHDRPMPVTSLGHADFVQTPSGDWWAVFLGVRPYENDAFNTGRETFLYPVEWKDGWPIVLPQGERLPFRSDATGLDLQPAALPMSGPFTRREEFDGPDMPLEWMMRRAPETTWWRLQDGALEILPNAEPMSGDGNPAFYGRRQQHMDISAQTLLDYSGLEEGDVAGLAIGQNEQFWMSVQVERIEPADLIAVRWRGGADVQPAGKLIATTALPGSFGQKVRLRIDGKGGNYTMMYASEDGLWQVLAEDLDGSILSTTLAGGFQGALVGPFAVDGAPGR